MSQKILTPEITQTALNTTINTEYLLRKACADNEHEIQQILGKALGYPWFKDDQKNWPGSTVEDGVCVGDHTAITLAIEAADRIKDLKHKGYEGTIEIDLDREVLFGRILFINDLVTYEAASITDLKIAFKEAIDDYLETRRQLDKNTL